MSCQECKRIGLQAVELVQELIDLKTQIAAMYCQSVWTELTGTTCQDFVEDSDHWCLPCQMKQLMTTEAWERFNRLYGGPHGMFPETTAMLPDVRGYPEPGSDEFLDEEIG